MEQNELKLYESRFNRIRKVVEKIEKSYEGYRSIMFDVEKIYTDKFYKEQGKKFAEFMLENTGMGKSTAYSLVKVAGGYREIASAANEKEVDAVQFLENLSFRELLALTKDSKFIADSIEKCDSADGVFELLDKAAKGKCVPTIESKEKESDATYTNTDSVSTETEGEEAVENSDVGKDELKIEITSDMDSLYDKLHNLLNTIRKSGKSNIEIKLTLRK